MRQARGRQKIRHMGPYLSFPSHMCATCNVDMPTIGALGWGCVWDAERVCQQAVPGDSWRVALKGSTVSQCGSRES